MAITDAAYEALRERAKAVKPEELLKPTRYWIAVLFEERDPSEVAEQTDFLWIKGNGKTTIEAVRNVYEQRKSGDFCLQLGLRPTESTERMADLNKYHDRLIVLLPIRLAPPVSSTHTSAVASSPPPMVKPEPVQAGPAALPPFIANSMHSTSTQASPTGRDKHMSIFKLSQRPAEPPSALAVSPTMSSQSIQPFPPPESPLPSQPPHLPSSTLATPGPSIAPAVPHEHRQLDGPQYTNDSRIMNAFQAAQSRQNTWLEPYLPQSQGKTAPSLASRHQSVGAHVFGTPSQHAASPFAPERPQLSSSMPLSTSSNRPPSEDQCVSRAPSGITAEPQYPFLQQLSSETDPEMLEKGVEKAMELLKKLQTRLNDDRTENRELWLQPIEDAEKGTGRTRTVIGVVGNTGAGKSSVINALLDEERLVPTNCMRACTAVVTELSYNDSEDEQSRYQADVEFIKQEDWHKELGTLFDELLDGSGKIAKEASNPDSEAGIAYAKISSVYPNKTKDQLATGGLEPLLRDVAVNNILGTTRHITDSDSLKFCQKLQTYVDSQEKASGRPKKDEIRRMEYWPLIKVVKIYTKADALSTGAVLVDLPGVHDSNAARAAVADGYIKQCTGLWIVAPITRAVDDKAAKTLLGNSFKRQLKLDGTYGNVTFICSKTDDISIEEAVLSLNLDETAETSWQESDDLRNQVEDIKNKISQCRDAKGVYSSIIDDCDEQMEIWEKLNDDLEDGKTVYPPSEKKRRRSFAKTSSQKKRRTEGLGDDFITDASEDSEPSASEPETEDEEGGRQALTSGYIESKKHELRLQKKKAKDERNMLEDQMKALRKETKELNERIAAMDHMISALCIKSRNDYSRGAIQQDFAAGIKELDMETALEEDEEHFDPDQELRDYDEVARSLPVFCISSRAFQKLSGRLKRDKAVPGFENINETEMPQLRAHCKKLTESGRAASSRNFLNSLSQLLNSMNLWASNGTNGSHLTADQQHREAQFLEQKLTELRNGLDKVVDKTLSRITDGLTQNIFDNYDRAIQNASDASIPTAQKWGAHRDEGGLHFQTYLATVRRNGVYAGVAGLRDFNGELAEPMMRQLTRGWERAFQRILPKQLDKFKTKTLEVLTGFHNNVIKRANDIGVSIAATTALSGQLRNYEPFLSGQVQTIKDMMTAFQREVNREFTPSIAVAMERAYDLCSAEHGAGSYMRMKGHMTTHVNRHRTKMFQDACNAVRKRLDEFSEKVKLGLGSRSRGVYDTAQRDYLAVLGKMGTAGVSATQVEVSLKSDISDILQTGEDMFRRLFESAEDRAEARDEVEAQEETENINCDEAHPGVGSAEDDTRNQVANEWEGGRPNIASEAKENSPTGGMVNLQKSADTATAEATVLRSLDTDG
ncbi:Dynamin family-domain-containing protein [Macrophomina phaseolina]|uniref:Dynamin family-domain-containing protein n=1 Tax=Macrophomina phaseolina TaxID=35725 RepID=A0ABQ8GCE4_9PEZI|nr:Dynamin family-domain-containing protein [Macrophomina phaseolina]